MLEKLQIVFTVISALFLAALLPVWAIFSWPGATVCGLGAGVFFTLVVIVKRANRKNAPSEEASEPAPAPEEKKNDENA